MPNPTVSVVLPVYNGARFIVPAVRSVLAQTFRDFECIVVDDGSTDDTPQLLAAEARDDERIRIHRQGSNLGFRVALNTGCELARGEFIARMDADDVSLPPRFERQVSFLRHNREVGAVGSAVQFIDADGVAGRTKRYPLDSGQASWAMLFFNSLVHPAAMMRRDALERAGRYPAGCAGGTEDYALFMNMSRFTGLANVPDVLLQYRVWGGNMSTQKWETQERDAVRILVAFVKDALDVELNEADAYALRGLSRDSFPTNAAGLSRLSRTIQMLAVRYAQRFPNYASAARTDAGIRLWLLTALSLRRAPSLAGSLASAAATTSATSIVPFAAKVLRRLVGGSG